MEWHVLMYFIITFAPSPLVILQHIRTSPYINTCKLSYAYRFVPWHSSKQTLSTLKRFLTSICTCQMPTFCKPYSTPHYNNCIYWNTTFTLNYSFRVIMPYIQSQAIYTYDNYAFTTSLGARRMAAPCFQTACVHSQHRGHVQGNSYNGKEVQHSNLYWIHSLATHM